MNVSQQLAKHFREVYFGGNWTFSNLKDQLSDIDSNESTIKIGSLNTIAVLVYHISYYITAATKVLQGGVLDSQDKYSFDHPPINSQEDWTNFVNSVLTDGEKFATLVENLPEEKLREVFSDPKYGTYYRNIQGIIEHSHYHLGQIALIKKLIRERESN